MAFRIAHQRSFLCDGIVLRRRVMLRRLRPAIDYNRFPRVGREVAIVVVHAAVDKRRLVMRAGGSVGGPHRDAYACSFELRHGRKIFGALGGPRRVAEIHGDVGAALRRELQRVDEPAVTENIRVEDDVMSLLHGLNEIRRGADPKSIAHAARSRRLAAGQGSGRP